MKKLNITKDKFTESKYFTTKYGTLEYVSESGNLYKTSKGNVIMFKEESDIPQPIRDAAIKAQRILKDKAMLGDKELKEFAMRAKKLHREELASAAEDILAYRNASKNLTDDRDGGKFVGSADEYSESMVDDDEMDDGEMVKICKKYHDRIMDGYDALVQFSEEIEDYAPTCQYEIDDAINNLNIVTRWIHMGANDQFYT